MKNKVYSVVISLLFLVTSLVIIFLIYFLPEFYVKSLVLNLCYSLFGGSFLAVAINIVDYYSLKNKTITSFYDECLEFIKLLNKIEFTYIGDRELIIAEYIYTKDFINHDNDAKEGYVKRAIKAFNEQGWKCDSNDILFCIENESKSFKKNLTNSMLSYIELSNYLYDRMVKVSSDIYFLFPITRKKRKENFELCEMTNEIIKKCTEASLHFSFYLNKETSNIFVITKLMQDLNNYIFKIEKKDNRILAWKEKMNSLNDLLNKFICAVNKKKYVKQEYSPFFGTILFLDNVENTK